MIPKSRLDERSTRVLRWLAPDRWRITRLFLLCVGNAGLSLLPPLVFQAIVDRALAPPFDPGLFYRLCGLILGATLLRSLVAVLQQLEAGRISTRVLFRMRQEFFEHLHRLPLGFVERAPSGEALTRIGRDLGEIQSVAVGALLSFAVSLLSVVGTVLLLASLDSRLLLASSIVLPFALLLTRRFRPLVIDRTQRVRRRNEAIASNLVESLLGMRWVRAMARERRAARRFVRLQAELSRDVMSMIRVGTAGAELPRGLLALSSVLVFAYGGSMVMDGRLGLGALLAFGLLQARVFGPLQGLFGLWLQLQRARVSMDRIFGWLEIEEPRLEAEDAVDPGRIAGNIRFEGLSHAWEPGRPALGPIDLEIPAGKRIGIIGPSGCGKSTLVALLFRLVRPTAGKILVDGRDLFGLRRRDLNRQMALVAQEPFLFHASIRDNVRIGDPEAPPPRFAEAIRIAGLDELAAPLPHGLDTVVGERGTALSGGEKQRITVARALVADPRILVLDEATSNLDVAADARLRRALDESSVGRTTIVISHRAETLSGCDAIFDLPSARFIEPAHDRRNEAVT